MTQITFNPMSSAKQLLNISEEIADINSTDRQSAKEKLVDRMVEKQRKAASKDFRRFVIPEGYYAGILVILMTDRMTPDEYYDFFATALSAIQGKPYSSKFAMFEVEGNFFPQIQILAETDAFPENVKEDVPKLKDMNQVLTVESGLIFEGKPQAVEINEPEPSA